MAGFVKPKYHPQPHPLFMQKVRSGQCAVILDFKFRIGDFGLGIGWRLAGLTNGKAIFQPAAAGKLQHFYI
ncbi:MAG: hypothetical protein A2V67_17130 [Deltaproteobacteria bacterium RBG_13_61_14]|nr:MAG: hypothetical protein A2V67_17130 [Deltaproteobacteria bacterium RBG_13_61_14]